MRWNCPHCGTSLAAADAASATAAEPSAAWKLFACFKCGGFSMRKSSTAPSSTLHADRDPTTPPPFRKGSPRVLQANRTPGPPVAASATTRVSLPAAGSEINVQPPLPEQERRIAPEPTVDFSVLRGHLRLSERKTALPLPSNRPSPTGFRVSPRRLKISLQQGILGLLIAASIGAGGLLYQQSLELERLTRTTRDTKPNTEVFEDRIEIRTAAPRRSSEQPAPSVQVDLTEPGMRYEILNRSAR